MSRRLGGPLQRNPSPRTEQARQYSEDEVFVAEQLGVSVEEARTIMDETLRHLAKKHGGMANVEAALRRYLVED